MTARLILLAAGTGSRLRPLTDDKPKALVPLAGKPLIEWQLAAAASAGLSQRTIVAGYLPEQLTPYASDIVINESFDRTNMVYSLYCARERLNGHVILSYGDIVCRPQVIAQLAGSAAPISIVVDKQWRKYWERRFDEPLTDAESLRVDDKGYLKSIGQKAKTLDEIEGQYIGLLSFQGAGVELLRRTLNELYSGSGADAPHARMFMTDLLQSLIDRGEALTPVFVDGGWLEVDSISDLKLAETMIAEGRLGDVSAWSFG